MTVTLPPGWEQFVEEQVESGRYPTADAVVSDALRLLREEEERRRKRDELRRDLADGLADVEQGKVAPFDPEATWERVRNRNTPQG